MVSSSSSTATFGSLIEQRTKTRTKRATGLASGSPFGKSKAQRESILDGQKRKCAEDLRNRTLRNKQREDTYRNVQFLDTFRSVIALKRHVERRRSKAKVGEVLSKNGNLPEDISVVHKDDESCRILEDAVKSRLGESATYSAMRRRLQGLLREVS